LLAFVIFRDAKITDISRTLACVWLPERGHLITIKIFPGG